MCEKVLKAASKHVVYDAQCARIDSFEDLVSDPIGRAERSGEFRYHIQVRNSASGVHKILIENWAARRDEGEFRKSGWTIRSSDPAESSAKIAALVGNLMDYEKDKDRFKTLLVAAGLSNSRQLKVDEKGRVIDTRNRKALDDAEAYDVFLAESEKHKNYLRAASEVAISFGVATAHYWSHQLFGVGASNVNAQDWQYGGKEGQARRWKNLDGVRFDDNSRGINVGHAFAGMWYYQLARSNNLSSMESFLYTFAASTLWEAASEYREVISINDEIITPVAGMVIGESLHQFGRYFYSKGTLPGKVLSTVFDSPAAINRLLDSRTPRSGSAAREYGFEPDAFGFMDFYVGRANGSSKGDAGPAAEGTVLGMRGEILNIPLFEEEGKVRQLYTDTVFTQLLVQSTGSESATQEFQALSKVVFAALHEKNIAEGPDGAKRGYSMFVGIAGGAEYNLSGKGLRDDEPRDWTATVNVVGTTVDYTVLMPGRVKLRAVLDVYGDFAMVRSYAIDAFKAANPELKGIQSVIDQHDYYYAWGITRAASLTASRGAWSGGIIARDNEFTSIQDRSRFSERVTRDLHLEDSRRDRQIWVSYDATKNVSVRFSVTRKEREGSIDGGLSVAGAETIRMGTINYRF